MLSVADASTRRHLVKCKRRVKKKEKVPKQLNVDNIVGFISKITPRYCDIALILMVVGLAGFGIFMIYAASNYNAQIYYGDAFYYTFKQSIGLLLGVIGLLIMYFIDFLV